MRITNRITRRFGKYIRGNWNCPCDEITAMPVMSEKRGTGPCHLNADSRLHCGGTCIRLKGGRLGRPANGYGGRKWARCITWKHRIKEPGL